MTISSTVILNSRLRQLILGKVTINVASSDEDNVPAVSRAYGCTLSNDGHIRIFVVQEQSELILRNIAAGRSIAAVFSRPTSHETIQLKASKAQLGKLVDGDFDVMSLYRESIISELGSIGHSRRFVEAIFPSAEARIAVISFMPEQIFEQTPGPKAGEEVIN